jgi:hypothetical protein
MRISLCVAEFVTGTGGAGGDYDSSRSRSSGAAVCEKITVTVGNERRLERNEDCRFLIAD